MAPSKEDRAETEEGIEVPAPTSGPLMAAFGLALLAASLVTNGVVGIVGALVLLGGAAAWWREVLPLEHTELLTLRAPAERVRPIVPRPQAGSTPALGEAGHRMRLPVEVYPYSAGIKGGAAGAMAMAAVAVLTGIALYGSAWYPINLLAGAALPGLALRSAEQLRQFNAVAFAVAAVVHVVLSLLVGLLYAALLPMAPRRPVLWGGLVVPLMWSGMMWATMGVLNPALNARVEWPSFILAQLAYGLAAGITVSRLEKVGTMQTWPLSRRAAVEMSGDRRSDR